MNVYCVSSHYSEGGFSRTNLPSNYTEAQQLLEVDFLSKGGFYQLMSIWVGNFRPSPLLIVSTSFTKKLHDANC